MRTINENKTNLLARMIRLYGFEHPYVVHFAEMCQQGVNEQFLELIVTTHEQERWS